ncbi:MAG TPA: hypothetical protein VGX28_10040 [Frankiaceae bacterium]|jgi:VIT1/CCC1 family predicted Fe2+/Mn2+ transporter|nr:hypothetical protein [Frankiaceae bacterium]
MRRVVGAVCHGTARRPLEPHGWVAPLLRAISWAMVALFGVALALVPVAYAASVPTRLVVAVFVYFVVWLLPGAVVARVLAEAARPADLTLRVAVEP